MTTAPLHRLAADAIRRAGALVITAGAGMGVDSGLPDFRGDRGFWKAYPLYERLGLSFVDAANPAQFEHDPSFGWGFYGHRAELYRTTTPHAGFGLLLAWIARYRLPWFVVTSNVDGQFQKAGFAADRVLELHGSIHHLQCLEPCSAAIWRSRERVAVDPATMRAASIPRCPRCGGVARPNIVMFGDASWLEERTEAQRRGFGAFLERLGDARLAVVELGAGTAIPSIRRLSEQLGRRPGATVIRVNPREPAIGTPHLALALGAREALEAVEAEMEAP